MRTRIFIDTSEGLMDQGLITDFDISAVEDQPVKWRVEEGEQVRFQSYRIHRIQFTMHQVGKNISVEKQIILGG